MQCGGARPPVLACAAASLWAWQGQALQSLKALETAVATEFWVSLLLLADAVEVHWARLRPAAAAGSRSSSRAADRHFISNPLESFCRAKVAAIGRLQEAIREAKGEPSRVEAAGRLQEACRAQRAGPPAIKATEAFGNCYFFSHPLIKPMFTFRARYRLCVPQAVRRFPLGLIKSQSTPPGAKRPGKGLPGMDPDADELLARQLQVGPVVTRRAAASGTVVPAPGAWRQHGWRAAGSGLLMTRNRLDQCNLLWLSAAGDLAGQQVRPPPTCAPRPGPRRRRRKTVWRRWRQGCCVAAARGRPSSGPRWRQG